MLAAQQHQLLRSFLRSAGDLPVEREPAMFKLPPDGHAMPPATPWVLSSPTRPPPEVPISLYSPPCVTSPLQLPRARAPSVRQTQASVYVGVNSAVAAELSRALQLYKHADLERQRLHRLAEMHAASTDVAIAKSARLEAALSATRSAGLARASREAELEASLVAARVRISELDALGGEVSGAFHAQLASSASEAHERLRVARGAEEAMRRELDVARREVAELRSREATARREGGLAKVSTGAEEALRRELDSARREVAKLRSREATARREGGDAELVRLLAEARAVADEDAARADKVEAQLREARARLAAAQREAERVPALQQQLASAAAAASAGGRQAARAPAPGVGGGGGGGGGGVVGGGATAGAVEAELSEARRQLSHFKSELSDALEREEMLHAQQTVCVCAWMGWLAHVHASRVERSARELRSVVAAEAAARPEGPGGGGGGGGGGGVPREDARGREGAAAPTDRQTAASAPGRPTQRTSVPPLSIGSDMRPAEPLDPTRPSIRTNLAPPSRVPFALQAEGAPGGGSSLRAALEARHMEKSLERDKLQAEYARMPEGSGKTLGERRQKAALEERLESLSAELGALNVRLRV
ncbi:hypothetical protein T492DRAFT_839722 [Pavlovales sp. CCMP2436]|nr:hypothetical protein T492DRAFT_839722 [Pavlovales sp. CCMP2436]